MRTDADTSAPLRPVWLSHHLECEADRCVRIADVPVCRRCSVVLAAALVTIAVIASPLWSGVGATELAVVGGGSLVAASEFVAVARGRMEYDPKRVVWLSLPVGALLGWLSHDAFTNGIGTAQLVGAGIALALLVVLAVSGRVVRRA